MLSFSFTDVNGEKFNAENPLYIVINRDENIPADDLTVVFPIMDLSRELCEVSAYEEDKIVFKGIVDEQINVTDEKDNYTKIIARSMAAVLLDNESRPISYSYPSTRVIVKEHLEPCGIKEYEGVEKTLDGNLKIPKGMSNWQAATAFSLKAFNRTPRVEEDGTVNFNGVESDLKLRFSNTDGIKYNSFKENNKRCKVLSRIYARTGSKGNYNTVLKNKKAEKRGVNRRRYIDTLADSSLLIGDAMIRNSEKSSYEITATSPECLLNALGAEAVFDDRKTLYNDLYVSGIYYRSTPEREETMLTIKKEFQNVDT